MDPLLHIKFEPNVQDGKDGKEETVLEGVEDGSTEVSYFVDEEGRYFCQPSKECNNIISLQENTVVENINTDEVNESEQLETVKLVTNEQNGEVSFVFIVQDDVKPVVEEISKTQVDDENIFRFQVCDDEEDLKPDIVKVKGLKYKGNDTFFCNECSYVTHRRVLLYRHMVSHSNVRPFKCSVCERGFKTQIALQNHTNTHLGVKPYTCKFCAKAVTTSGELIRHVRYKHTMERPHKCSECDYASVELPKLRRHMRSHTGEKPYQCQHCTYAAPDSFKLKRHLRTHTGEKPFKCDECNVCFTQSNTLKAHKLRHSGKTIKLSCDICPAKLSRKTDLRIHMQTLHAPTVPNPCKICGKSFPDRYTYKMHVKTHEGEKCYRCALCTYATSNMKHLKMHALRHTDEKPFECTKCNAKFRQKQLLVRHTKLHHTPGFEPTPPKEKKNACSQCKKTFAHKGNLIRHMAVHDPDSKHKENTLALKLGQQKNIKNGYVEEITEDSTDDDIVSSDILKLKGNDKYGEIVAVKNGDGKQYVVLEVIEIKEEEDNVEDEQQEFISEKVNLVQSKNKEEECFGFEEEYQEDEEI